MATKVKMVRLQCGLKQTQLSMVEAISSLTSHSCIYCYAHGCSPPPASVLTNLFVVLGAEVAVKMVMPNLVLRLLCGKYRLIFNLTFYPNNHFLFIFNLLNLKYYICGHLN